MPSAAEFWEVAAQVVSERGGLVVGFSGDSTQPELGSTLDNVLGFKPPRPPTVVRVSDWIDWKEQVEAFYRLRPAWGRGKGGDPEAKYYRVKFDELGGIRLNLSPDSVVDLLSLSQPPIASFSGYAAPVSTLQGVAFWPRVLARVIDFAVHRFVAIVAGVMFAFMLAIAAGGPAPIWVLRRITQTRLPLFLGGLFGFFAYHVICTSIHGSSLGKLLFSFQVGQEDGSRCRPKSAIIRELGYFVDAMFFGLIGYMAMRDDPQQMRQGDRWANTMVCKRANIPPRSRQGGLRFVLGLMLGVCADIALLMVGLLVQMNS